jgi:hypothetical protein
MLYKGLKEKEEEGINHADYNNLFLKTYSNIICITIATNSQLSILFLV